MKESSRVFLIEHSRIIEKDGKGVREEIAIHAVEAADSMDALKFCSERLTMRGDILRWVKSPPSGFKHCRPCSKFVDLKHNCYVEPSPKVS